MPVSSLYFFRGISCCLLLSGLTPAFAETQNNPNEASNVRSVVEPIVKSLMSRHAIAGMAVAVTLKGQRYLLNFGVASKESGAPVTDNTLFEIGSLTKTLTATLAAYAQTTGKMSLSDHPGQYVPQLHGKAIDNASLLELGTYTAGGLPLQFPDAVNGPQATLDYYSAWPPTAPTGTVRQYSNPSIGLLGLTASNALGQDFSDAMQRIVFPAFGMSHTFIRIPEKFKEDYAWGYRADKPVRVNPGPMDEQAYGVKTTAADMLRFVQLNIDPSPLAGPMQRAVRLTQVGFFRAGPIVQGLGWEQYTYPVALQQLLDGNSAEVSLGAVPVQKIQADAAQGARLFNKTGATGGFGAYAMFVPSEQIGIVMLANKNYAIPARVDAAYAILNGLLARKP